MNQNNENEFLSKLNEMLAMQQELQMMMAAIAGHLPLLDITLINQAWLNREEVIAAKFWTERKFYREQKANKEKWKRKKEGHTWYYLQSSL
ncbi:hypothetical protein LPB86_06225 [Pedobacter sp. MC2016-14]|uniref:hypothetical protein n=1 Tax=Pedobacter sp. MC2016-14 TaxID=2897327 RepID=UPI001E28B3AD|nr:hypothetical protein [Pedobacter sp. MC2016-14]MCD0487815.1 hypothetical protein [Pedobacter sp. MC2016-14]